MSLQNKYPNRAKLLRPLNDPFTHPNYIFKTSSLDVVHEDPDTWKDEQASNGIFKFKLIK